MPSSSAHRVAIVIGSDSDWPVMKACAETLSEFNVPWELHVLSAHRCPHETAQYAQTARDKGFQVIIAAAGLAAHLAGTLAAHTTLPVLGVPLAGGTLQGIDALLSTVQMPPGVPVATLGIGSAGAKNAALLAVQILALNDAKLAQMLAEHKTHLTASVKQKDARLQKELP